MVLPYAMNAAAGYRAHSFGKFTITAADDSELFLEQQYGDDVNGRPICRFFLISNATSAEIDTAGVFNSFAEFMGIGSLVFSSFDIDGTDGVGCFRVTDNDGSTVDLSNVSSFGLADTD